MRFYLDVSLRVFHACNNIHHDVNSDGFNTSSNSAINVNIDANTDVYVDFNNLAHSVNPGPYDLNTSVDLDTKTGRNVNDFGFGAARGKPGIYCDCGAQVEPDVAVSLC